MVCCRLTARCLILKNLYWIFALTYQYFPLLLLQVAAYALHPTTSVAAGLHLDI